jgi:hypothetical protein
VVISWFKSLNAGRLNGCNSRIAEIKNKKYLKLRKRFNKGRNGQMKIRKIKESFRRGD